MNEVAVCDSGSSVGCRGADGNVLLDELDLVGDHPLEHVANKDVEVADVVSLDLAAWSPLGRSFFMEALTLSRSHSEMSSGAFTDAARRPGRKIGTWNMKRAGISAISKGSPAAS